MSRRAVFGCLAAWIFLLIGCGYIPILNQTGLLPGPSPSLLVKVLSASELGVLLGAYGDIGTQTCPSDQIWIGTLNIAGQTISVNSCISLEMATQYAQSAGLF